LEKDTIQKLEGIVGSTNLLVTEEDRACYAYDGTFQFHMPDVVVKPRNKEQVAQILKLACSTSTPVYPRGAGTGLSGGALPVKGGIAMVLSDMNKIIDIDKENLVAVVEPGVVTARLQAEVEQLGLFYPPDPASCEVSTIGGNIAECAGGPRCFKYGVTRDYVLGLEVVTPTGEIINTGGKTIKNVTGYDLTRLIVGSEGTLGVVTRAILRLVPRPKSVRTALVAFDDLYKASEAVLYLSELGVVPATMEILDEETIKCVEKFIDYSLPFNARAVLLIEVDGRPLAVEEEMKMVREACLAKGAQRVEVASTAEERNKLWNLRRSVSPALVKIAPTKISEDATVPRARVPEMITRLQKIKEKYNINLVIFGHIGDGNLHPNIMTDERNSEEMTRVEKAINEIFQTALELGGTLSGEHGIGNMKSPFMEMEMGNDGLAYMYKIKKSLDPKGILNPGKLFIGDQFNGKT